MRLLSIAGMLLLLVDPSAAASWGTGHIGIYADAAGTRACTDIPEGSFALLYVIATRGENDRGSLVGAEFRIEIKQPQEWSVLYKPQQGAVITGNLLDRFPEERNC